MHKQLIHKELDELTTLVGRGSTKQAIEKLPSIIKTLVEMIESIPSCKGNCGSGGCSIDGNFSEKSKPFSKKKPTVTSNDSEN